MLVKDSRDKSIPEIIRKKDGNKYFDNCTKPIFTIKFAIIVLIMVIWVVKVPGRGSKIRKKINTLIPRLETRQPILPLNVYMQALYVHIGFRICRDIGVFFKSGKGNSPDISTQKQTSQ